MNSAKPIFVLLFCILTTNLHAEAFDAQDYKKALWMTTRFYGAQRSGIGPNWLIMEHENPQYRTSFTQDADRSVSPPHDLEGGWFDCGDHATFGQTFFYSAYLLAKAYEAFPTGFHDLYDGKTTVTIFNLVTGILQVENQMEFLTCLKR